MTKEDDGIPNVDTPSMLTPVDGVSVDSTPFDLVLRSKANMQDPNWVEVLIGLKITAIAFKYYGDQYINWLQKIREVKRLSRAKHDVLLKKDPKQIEAEIKRNPQQYSLTTLLIVAFHHARMGTGRDDENFNTQAYGRSGSIEGRHSEKGRYWILGTTSLAIICDGVRRFAPIPIEIKNEIDILLKSLKITIPLIGQFGIVPSVTGIGRILSEVEQINIKQKGNPVVAKNYAKPKHLYDYPGTQQNHIMDDALSLVQGLLVSSEPISQENLNVVKNAYKEAMKFEQNVNHAIANYQIVGLGKAFGMVGNFIGGIGPFISTIAGTMDDTRAYIVLTAVEGIFLLGAPRFQRWMGSLDERNNKFDPTEFYNLLYGDVWDNDSITIDPHNVIPVEERTIANLSEKKHQATWSPQWESIITGIEEIIDDEAGRIRSEQLGSQVDDGLETDVMNLIEDVKKFKTVKERLSDAVGRMIVDQVHSIGLDKNGVIYRHLTQRNLYEATLKDIKKYKDGESQKLQRYEHVAAGWFVSPAVEAFISSVVNALPLRQAIKLMTSVPLSAMAYLVQFPARTMAVRWNKRQNKIDLAARYPGITEDTFNALKERYLIRDKEGEIVIDASKSRYFDKALHGENAKYFGKTIYSKWQRTKRLMRIVPRNLNSPVTGTYHTLKALKNLSLLEIKSEALLNLLSQLPHLQRPIPDYGFAKPKKTLDSTYKEVARYSVIDEEQAQIVEPLALPQHLQDQRPLQWSAMKMGTKRPNASNVIPQTSNDIDDVSKDLEAGNANPRTPAEQRNDRLERSYQEAMIVSRKTIINKRQIMEAIQLLSTGTVGKSQARLARRVFENLAGVKVGDRVINLIESGADIDSSALIQRSSFKEKLWQSLGTVVRFTPTVVPTLVHHYLDHERLPRALASILPFVALPACHFLARRMETISNDVSGVLKFNDVLARTLPLDDAANQLQESIQDTSPDSEAIKKAFKDYQKSKTLTEIASPTEWHNYIEKLKGASYYLAPFIGLYKLNPLATLYIQVATFVATEAFLMPLANWTKNEDDLVKALKACFQFADLRTDEAIDEEIGEPMIWVEGSLQINPNFYPEHIDEHKVQEITNPVKIRLNLISARIDSLIRQEEEQIANARGISYQEWKDYEVLSSVANQNNVTRLRSDPNRYTTCWDEYKNAERGQPLDDSARLRLKELRRKARGSAMTRLMWEELDSRATSLHAKLQLQRLVEESLRPKDWRELHILEMREGYRSLDEIQSELHDLPLETKEINEEEINNRQSRIDELREQKYLLRYDPSNLNDEFKSIVESTLESKRPNKEVAFLKKQPLVEVDLPPEHWDAKFFSTVMPLMLSAGLEFATAFIETSVPESYKQPLKTTVGAIKFVTKTFEYTELARRQVTSVYSNAGPAGTVYVDPAKTIVSIAAPAGINYVDATKTLIIAPAATIAIPSGAQLGTSTASSQSIVSASSTLSSIVSSITSTVSSLASSVTTSSAIAKASSTPTTTTTSTASPQPTDTPGGPTPGPDGEPGPHANANVLGFGMADLALWGISEFSSYMFNKRRNNKLESLEISTRNLLAELEPLVSSGNNGGDDKNKSKRNGKRVVRASSSKPALFSDPVKDFPGTQDDNDKDVGSIPHGSTPIPFSKEYQLTGAASQENDIEKDRCLKIFVACEKVLNDQLAPHIKKEELTEKNWVAQELTIIKFNLIYEEFLAAVTQNPDIKFMQTLFLFYEGMQQQLEHSLNTYDNDETDALVDEINKIKVVKSTLLKLDSSLRVSIPEEEWKRLEQCHAMFCSGERLIDPKYDSTTNVSRTKFYRLYEKFKNSKQSFGEILVHYYHERQVQVARAMQGTQAHAAKQKYHRLEEAKAVVRAQIQGVQIPERSHNVDNPKGEAIKEYDLNTGLPLHEDMDVFAGSLLRSATASTHDSSVYLNDSQDNHLSTPPSSVTDIPISHSLGRSLPQRKLTFSDGDSAIGLSDDETEMPVTLSPSLEMNDTHQLFHEKSLASWREAFPKFYEAVISGLGNKISQIDANTKVVDLNEKSVKVNLAGGLRVAENTRNATSAIYISNINTLYIIPQLLMSKLKFTGKDNKKIKYGEIGGGKNEKKIAEQSKRRG